MPFGNVEQVGVTVEIPAAVAGLPSAQHTAWMLINLLARFQGVVRKVGVRCPPGVALGGHVVPLAPRNLDLATALVAGGNAIGVVPVERDAQLDRTIVVGPDLPATAKADLFASGAGWCGGVSVGEPSVDALDLASPLPFGPYLAACIAAGEIFKAARMHPETYTAPPSAFYSCWNHAAGARPVGEGPPDVDIAIDASLVGVGAVGCAVTHALWACSALRGSLALIDHDPKGVETSNLNRYSIFGQASVGHPKATAAAQTLSDASIRWVPHNDRIESFRLATPRVVSAVDRNTARAAIQNQYPARIFSGSTLDLRAEVLRCGPPGLSACLRCFNEPERIPPDEELRSKLKAASEAELASLARSAGITLAEAKDWIATGRCGVAGERLLPLLRQDDGDSEFAVAFVSVMAGTMLAAELLKDHLVRTAPLCETRPRAAFQFFSPLARSNRAVPFRRDPTCPMCAPDSIACATWVRRYGSLAQN